MHTHGGHQNPRLFIQDPPTTTQPPPPRQPPLSQSHASRWCGLLLREGDCAVPISSLRVGWTGNSGIQATYHHIDLKLEWALPPSLTIGKKWLEGDQSRPFEAWTLRQRLLFLEPLGGPVHTCRDFYMTVFQTNGERWGQTTNSIGIINYLYRKVIFSLQQCKINSSYTKYQNTKSKPLKLSFF